MSFIILLFTAMAATPSHSAQSSLRDAEQALKDGHYERARLHARDALNTPGAHDQEASYYMALAWQLDNHPDDALTLYRSAIARQPLGAFVGRAELGVAESLADLGRPRDALRSLRQAKKHLPHTITNQARLSICHDLWLLQRGRLRRGTRRLLRTLQDVDHDIATWHQGKARTALINRWLDVADKLGVEDPTWLTRRAVLLDGARRQLHETAAQDHPRWTLQQLYRIGQSYERLGDDVVAAAGSTLHPDAKKRAAAVWKKAGRFYAIGAEHASRTESTDSQHHFDQASNALLAKVNRL